jgi:hypothetical protein
MYPKSVPGAQCPAVQTACAKTAGLNCHTLTLSEGAFSNAPTASMPAVARPHCILRNRDFEMLAFVVWPAEVEESSFFPLSLMAYRASVAFVAAASAAAASAAAASAAAAEADAAEAVHERTPAVSLSQLTLSVTGTLCDYADCRKPLYKVLQCAKCKGVAYCSKDCQVCSPSHPACALSRPQTYPSCPLLLTRVFVTCRSLCVYAPSLTRSLTLLPHTTHPLIFPSDSFTHTNLPLWDSRLGVEGRTHASTHTRTHACTHARAHAHTHTRSSALLVRLPPPTCTLSVAARSRRGRPGTRAIARPLLVLAFAPARQRC